MMSSKLKKLLLSVLSKRGYIVIRNMTSDPNMYLKYFCEDSIKNKRFYNIGAGGFTHPYWTNVDYESEWYAANDKYTKRGISYDLLSLSPIPINSDSAEIIYTSHTIEHITDKATQFVFGEIYRCLKNNGILRIITPNIELAHRAFKENDIQYFQQFEKRKSSNTDKIANHTIEQYFLEHFATCLSTINEFGDKKITDDEIRKIFSEQDLKTALNYFTSLCTLEIQRKFPGNHINWYNKEKIFEMLGKAGFKKIFLSGFGQSFSPVLRDNYYFDNTHSENSIYVEAIK